jgi:hypothetical protein
MNDFESRLSTALREEAEEFSMNVDVQKGASELEVRLDGADRSKRRTYGLWALAAVAVVALMVVGYGLISPRQAPTPKPAVTPTRDFSTTQFGLPFSVDLPGWVRTSSVVPVSEKPEWTTWNRCPSPDTECIGLSFNRNATVPGRPGPLTYASFLAYLDGLATEGDITISARSTTTVGGRPATVMSILPVRTVVGSAGCHADLSCEDLLEGVPTRIAVVDSAALDPDGQVLVIWTRAGAVAAPEAAWLSDFDLVLADLIFVGPSPSSS